MSTRPSLIAATAVLIPAAALAASTGASASASPALPVDHTTTYAGPGVSATQTSLDVLAATDESFVDYVGRFTRSRDDRASTREQKDCTGSTTVVVEKFTTRGYAYGAQGRYAPCPDGGAVQMYVRHDGYWSAPKALRTQEAFFRCRALARFHVPVDMNVGKRCMAGDRETGYKAYRARHR